LTSSYQRPRPASEPEIAADAGRRHDSAVAALEAEAAKRFWTLVPEDHTASRFSVFDEAGRILCGPAHLPQLRGFFAAQPPQA
jgi:hypothetical protein